MIKAISILALLVSTLCLCSSTLSAQSINPRQTLKQLYVDPSGSDRASGTKDKPLASPQGALKKVLKLKKNNSDLAFEIILNNGIYFLKEPLVIDPSLSGTPVYPLRIKAETPGKAILSAAKPLKLKWRLYTGKIWETDVPKGTSFDQLYTQSKKLIRARYPNFDKDILPYNGYAKDATSPERVKSWADPQGGIIHALHKGRWGGFHYQIEMKLGDGSLELSGGQQNNRPSEMHETYRFVENIFEELDAPGEWYLNRKTAKLYYMPYKDEFPNKMQFLASKLENIISITSDEKNPVHDIEISGIQFQHTSPTFMKTSEPLLRSDWTIYRGGAVLLQGAERCYLDGNIFRELGGNAIFLSKYNRDIQITGNLIENIGAGAINFVGDPSAVRSPAFQYSKFVPLEQMDKRAGPKSDNYPKNCIASNNLIHDIGTIEKQVAGIQISMSESLGILNNTIYNVPRAGINIGDGTWGGHEIAYNDVFNTVLETSDHGAFNSWGRDRFWHPQRKTMDELTAAHPQIILLDAYKTTRIHDNRFRCDHGWDIDLDDGSSNYEIFNNLCLSGGIKLREGFYRNVYNNVMVNNGFHPHVWFKDSHDVFKNNVVMSAHQDIQVNYWGEEVDNNIYANPKDREKDQKKGIEKSAIVKNLQFVDPKTGDFSLKDMDQTGFRNFDMLHFGVTSPKLKALAESPVFPSPLAGKGQAAQLPWTWKGGTFKTISSLGEQSAAGLPSMQGVLVIELEGSSPLAKSGLRKGDVILTYIDQKTNDLNDFSQAVKKYIHNGAPTLVIFRNQTAEKLKIQF